MFGCCSSGPRLGSRRRRKKAPLVRTRLIAAEQRLALAGLLSDRLAEWMVVQVPMDLLGRVAAALAPPGVECVFSGLVSQKAGEFDRCGALHHIAAQGGTTVWQNPAIVGSVAVAWSSMHCCPPSNLVSGPAREGFRGGHSYTRDMVNSSMALDLGRDRRMEVTGYALRNGGIAEYSLRSWELQGSEAKEGPWLTLDKRRWDKTISGDWGAGYWAVDETNTSLVGCGAVQHVRILQTAKNAWGSHQLCCGGLELYGVLHEMVLAAGAWSE